MNQDVSTISKKSSVKFITIGEDEAGQRIDNFLINYLKRIPKSRVYRLIRKGEVRVNKRRIDAFYRLIEGDIVRIPPVVMDEKAVIAQPASSTLTFLENRIIYEDDYVIILNKPSGMPVHAGSKVKLGIIEALRHHLPKLKNLELAHRLDAETSGCLILAKKKRILREVHELLRQGKVRKIYWALTMGQWKEEDLNVELPLHKAFKEDGKHVVSVKTCGKAASTHFKPLKVFKRASLMRAELLTGRTHQIRVHAAFKGHPIAGDDRYGDVDFNKFSRNLGLNRMFLHARSIDFTLPSLTHHIKVEAPLDPELEKALELFAKKG